MNQELIKKVVRYAKGLCKRGYRKELVSAWLKKQGFIFLDSGNCYGAFADPEYKFVVKYLFTDGMGRALFPRKCTPVAKFFLYPIFHTRRKEIIIQPYADRTDGAKHRRTIAETGIDYFDFCDCNVGTYEGRPVIFDYMNIKWYLNSRYCRESRL